MTQSCPAVRSESPTAAILVIGNEILSGSTQDANIAFIAQRLFNRGIRLAEVRIVGDTESAIVGALNALRAAYTHVFTTGGIGPTHDDVTAESVSKAFGVPCEINAEAREIMARHYAARGVVMNEARLRMARVPAGGKLIVCDATIAPGFKMGNVHVLAGVPAIMRAQMLSIENSLEAGKPLLSRTVQCNQKEGDIAFALEDIQHAFPDVDIGSYPHMGQTPALSLILRGTDDDRLKEAQDRVADMIRALGEEPVLPA